MVSVEVLDHFSKPYTHYAKPKKLEKHDAGGRASKKQEVRSEEARRKQKESKKQDTIGSRRCNRQDVGDRRKTECKVLK